MLSSFRIQKAALVPSECSLASPSPIQSTDCGISKFVREPAGTIRSFSVGLRTSYWLAVAANPLSFDSAVNGQTLAPEIIIPGGESEP